MPRHARAALAAASAAAAYYAAAALRSQRPVRLGALFVLAAGALAGTMAQGAKASAKAYEVESRLNQFFQGGNVAAPATQGEQFLDDHLSGTLVNSEISSTVDSDASNCVG